MPNSSPKNIGNLIEQIKQILDNNNYKDKYNAEKMNIRYDSNMLSRSTSNTVYVSPIYGGKKNTKSLDDKLYSDIKSILSERIGLIYSKKINFDRNDKLKIGNFSIFIKKPLKVDPLAKQKEQIKSIINNLNEAYGKSKGDTNIIKIKIGKDTYNILYSNNTVQSKETSDKCDVIIKTVSGDIFISLKDESQLQWSGVSDFKDDPEVENFIDYVKTQKNFSGFSRKILSTELCKKSMYGKDYSNSAVKGLNNVNYIISGDISFEPDQNNVYELKSTKAIYVNGQLPTNSDYPHLNTSSDTRRNDMNLPNTRVTIWPGRKGNNTLI